MADLDEEEFNGFGEPDDEFKAEEGVDDDVQFSRSAEEDKSSSSSSSSPGKRAAAKPNHPPPAFLSRPLKIPVRTQRDQTTAQDKPPLDRATNAELEALEAELDVR